MFGLIGQHACIENLRAASAASGFRIDGDGLPALKFAYNRWLAAHLGPQCASQSMTPELISEPQVEAALLSLFIETQSETDCLDAITPRTVTETIARRDPAHIDSCLAATEEARDELWALAPDWGQLFDLFVNKIFVADIAGNAGGSTGRAIGIMWVNLPLDIPLADRVEYAIHELTHHIIFVDSAHTPHYGEIGHDTFARSTIRGTARPLPAVFDSLLVALEILYFRSFVSPVDYVPQLHPSTEIVLEQAAKTFDSIDRIDDLDRALAPRGFELLARARWLYNVLLRHHVSVPTA